MILHMRKICICWSAFVLASVFSPLGKTVLLAQEAMEDVIERVEKSVIRIEVEGAEGASLGSGFVVDNRGTIVSNCHVLAGAQKARVFFPNGKQTEIVGTMLIDETRDIVVARIGITDAPPIEIASGLPRKGERVIALGAPFGLAFSATTGIISAIRSAAEMQSDVNRSEVGGTWIQVDAPLSPGNSGGPLINSTGQLVGMSTLASGGGRAQNLNFGISVTDVRNAIKYADGVPPIPLSAGIGKVRMESKSEKRGPSGGESDGSGPNMARREVTPEILAKYVNTGVRDYDKLVGVMRTEKTRLSNELSEMKRGRTAIPSGLGQSEGAVVKAKLPGVKTPIWFFDGEDTKNSTIERQKQRIKKSNELQSSLKGKEDQTSVTELLINAGPALDPKKNNTIGIARDIIVLHSFNNNIALCVWEENPYLYYADSTAGLFPGELLSVPVMVAGTEVIENSKRSGLTTAVTVLQRITDEEIKSAVQTRMGFRTWRSGQHTVEAKLLSLDADNLTLKKRDGSVVKVSKSKIDAEDLRLLEQ
jgi:S1-C subfamily serine protease